MVPHAGPVTVDSLLTIPDDGYVYEVVDRVLVRVAGSGNHATTIALALGAELRAYARPHRLGVVTGADGMYKFPGAETGLIPDVGYYTAERISLITDEDKPLPFAPDLAVEVASPSQDAAEMAAKARPYLRGGPRLVWVVWPQSAHIDVGHPATLAGPSGALVAGQSLEGEGLIPGFSYPLAKLFAPALGAELGAES